MVDDGNHVCGAYLHVGVVGIAWEDEGTQSVDRIHAHGLPLDPATLVACIVSRVCVVVRAVCQLSVGVCGLCGVVRAVCSPHQSLPERNGICLYIRLSCRLLCVKLLLVHLLAYEAIVECLGGGTARRRCLRLGESFQQAVEIDGEQQVGVDRTVAYGFQLPCLHRGAAHESLNVVDGIVGTA